MVAEAPRAMIDLNRSVEDRLGHGARRRMHPVRHSLANSGRVMVSHPCGSRAWAKSGDGSRKDSSRTGSPSTPPPCGARPRTERLRDRWWAMLDLHSILHCGKSHPRIDRPNSIGDRFAHATPVSSTRYSPPGQPGRQWRTIGPIRGYMPTGTANAGSSANPGAAALSARPTAEAAGPTVMLGGLVRMLGTEVGSMGRGERMAQAAE